MVLLSILIALVCILLIISVIIQNPKGGGLSSTFGGSQAASQLMGAARSTDILERITWGFGIAMGVLCIVAALVIGKGGSTTITDDPQMETPAAPTTPQLPQQAPPPTGGQ